MININESEVTWLIRWPHIQEPFYFVFTFKTWAWCQLSNSFFYFLSYVTLSKKTILWLKTFAVYLSPCCKVSMLLDKKITHTSRVICQRISLIEIQKANGSEESFHAFLSSCTRRSKLEGLVSVWDLFLYVKWILFDCFLFCYFTFLIFL